MKILFLTPVVPTKTDGKRPYNFLRYLADEHEVHLICLKMPVQSPTDIRHLQEMGIRVSTIDIMPTRSVFNCLFGLPLRKPLRVSWCLNGDFRSALEQKLQQMSFDIVHIDRMRMGQYAKYIPFPKIIDFTDSLKLYLDRSIQYRRKIQNRFIDGWERWSIPGYERWILKNVSAALVCSTIDADYFKKDHSKYEFSVIDNAVDIDQFYPKKHEDHYQSKCIITGTLFYFANIDSVRFYDEDILPTLRKEFPSLETQIIGTRPKKEIKKLDGKKGITICADVPRMEDYLFQDDIYLCPLRVAAGVRNKLLEAMSSGMPIVTTKLGAEGLDVKHEKEVLFAETPDEYVSAVKRLLESKQLCQQLGKNGRRYVEEKHTIDVLGKKLEELYDRTISLSS
jgi:glycosyltransferase involved in cell wall biosynthesis